MREVNCMRSFLLLILGLYTISPLSTFSADDDVATTKTDAVQFGEQDWPWWRGPSGDGVAPANQKPATEWGATKNIAWQVSIPGRGHASPTVVGDQVFLPTADHDRGVQIVLCFDRKTGKKQWETVVHKGGLMVKNRKASQASCTIACDGKRLFVNFLNSGAAWTTALTRDGKQLWQKKISNYKVHQGYGSSPAFYKHLVIVSADNKAGGAIVAFERVTGKEVWRVARPKEPNYSSPTIVHVDGKDQLIFIGCDLVTSLTPLTGKKHWEFKGATTECVTTTVTDGTHIYSTGGYPKNHVAAIKADGSGKVVWENKERVYVPSMLFHEGYLYALGDPGSAYCWKADTGKQAWKQRLGGGFTASPVRVGNHIYAINERGMCFVYKATPKGFEEIARNQLGNEALASPVICGGRVYLRVAHKKGGSRQEVLYCIK